MVGNKNPLPTLQWNVGEWWATKTRYRPPTKTKAFIYNLLSGSARLIKSSNPGSFGLRGLPG